MQQYQQPVADASLR